MVEGNTTAVSMFVDQMLSATTDVGGRLRHLVVDGTQVVANAAAVRQAHREYIEFSDRAAELMRQHGTIATEDGFFRSMVHDGKGLAGNLDWRPVDLSVERALSLQAVAGQLALRAAIKEVTVALERVEGKIDSLVSLAEAERLGAVVGDRATLQPLAERVRKSNELNATDWSTVASLGPLIARDIEALRVYVDRELNKVSESWLVRSRAGAAQELTDRMLRESLALLVVAEDNYALWQELRLAHAVNHEPTAVAAITADVHVQLHKLTEADQQLADRLQSVTDRLSSPTGYEGIAPLQRRRLKQRVGQLDAMRSWFLEQRHLDDVPSERGELPRFTDTIGKVSGAIATRTRETARSVASRPRRGSEPHDDTSQEPGSGE